MTNQYQLHHPLHGLQFKQSAIIAVCAILVLSPLFNVAFANIPSRSYSAEGGSATTAPAAPDVATSEGKTTVKNNNTEKTATGSTQASTENLSAPTQSVSKQTASVAAPMPAPTQPTPYTGWHTTTATKFWVGEAASPDNGYIANFSSAWTTDWVAAFGGVDDPYSRCGYNPCAFTPNENPFYAALPYGDYTESGQRSNLNVIPWFSGSVPNGSSILKNKWIAVSANGKTTYVQWEDVGPFNDDDHGYVFGTNASAYHAGIDLSPAAMDYLGIGGAGTVAWRFVESYDVPAGPWTNITTGSPPNW